MGEFDEFKNAKRCKKTKVNLISPQAQSMVGDKIPGMGGGAAEAPADGEAPAEVGLCQQHQHCHHHHHHHHHCYHHHHQCDLGNITNWYDHINSSVSKTKVPRGINFTIMCW